MADYRNPQWLLPNCKNLKLPETGATTGSGLTEDRHSLYSMDFDGVDDIITIGTSTGVDFSNPFTISLWAKWTAADIIDNTAGIIQLAKESQSYSFMIGTGLGSSNNTFSVSWNNNHYEFGGSYGDGNWHNIIVTGDGVNWSGVKIYIDGSNVTSSAIATSSIGVNSTVSYIGQNTYSGNRQFKGLIDEVALWSSDQSNNISNIYNGGSPANIMALSNKPTAYYPLGEQARDNTEWQFPNQVLQSHVFDFNNGNLITTSALSNFVTSNITASLWVNYATLPASYTGNPMGATNGGSWNSGFGFVNNGTSGKLRFFIENWSNASAGGFVDNTTTLTTNTWFHLAGTWDGSTVTFYINGVSQGTASYNGSLTTSDVVAIGTNLSTSGYNIDAMISNVAIFNQAISASGIEQLYNEGTPQTNISFEPVSWWKLDAATSSYDFSTSTWTITDSAGSNNGTSTTLPSTALVPSDLQFESPYSNFSLYFDGTGDKVDFGDSDVFSFGDGVTNTAFSTSIWFKLGPTTTSGIWTKQVNDTTSAEYQIYRANNFIGFTIASTPPGSTTRDGAISVKIEPTLSQDVWYHLVTTYDGTQGTNTQVQAGMKIYLNGIDNTANNFTNGTFTAMKNGTAPLQIGALQTAAVYDFDGNLDEAAIFSKALTQTEVSQIYNNGYAADLTSLSPVSWWRLGEDAYFVGNDITLPNQIANAPNGTGSGTQTSMLVADAPGSYASGVGTNLAVEDRKGDAPESTANSLSFNMIPTNRVSYPAGYTTTQVDNVYSMAFDRATITQFQAGPVTFGTNDFSICFWMRYNYVNSTTLRYSTFFNTQTSGSDDAFMIYTYQNKLSIYSGAEAITNDASRPDIPGTSGTGLQPWTHIVLVRTASTNTWQTFANGSVYHTFPSSSASAINYESRIIELGTNHDDSLPLDGFLDEVAIFDYALSERQIKQDIYEGTTTGKTADLNNISNLKAPVAWYRMGD